jgi:hypothetical protein
MVMGVREKLPEAPWDQLGEILGVLKQMAADQKKAQQLGLVLPQPLSPQANVVQILASVGMPVSGLIPLDMGVATGGSPTLLQDNSKAWATNIWPGSYLSMYIGGQKYSALIASNTTNALTFPTLPGGIQVAQGTPYVISNANMSLSLDVPLSTRASQTTLISVLSKLNVNLDTRGSEATLLSLLAKLDVALSTRASQATVASILSALDVSLSTRASQATVASILAQLNVTSTVQANLTRWGIPREPFWVYGVLIGAPGAGTALVTRNVTAAMTGRVFGVKITATEANQFDLYLNAVFQTRVGVLGAAGTIYAVLAAPIVDGIAAGVAITVQNVAGAGIGSVYQSDLFYDEA